MMSVPRFFSVRCAASTTVVKAPAAAKNLKAMNLSKGSLLSWGGRTTKNIDGVLYDISYNEAEDTVMVVDRAQQIQYPATVGAKDNRIAIDLDEPLYLNNTPNFTQLQAVLRGNAVGPEFLNGRVAMLAFFGCTVMELSTQKTVVEQALSPAGAAAAVALVSLTVAASLAPAFAGKQRIEKVFPSQNDPYSDRQLPFFFHPLAETINGRAGMIGMLALVGYELVKGTPMF